MTRAQRRILRDWRYELDTARKWQQEGRTTVSSDVAGPGVSKGRFMIPMQEYVDHWQKGVSDMEADPTFDPDLFAF